jgi:acyl-coenzyme A thioesterase PaaI-like protein
LSEADAALTAAARTSMPFAELLGIEVAASADDVRARMSWEERLCTAGGVLHGRAVCRSPTRRRRHCAFHNLRDDSAGTATIESKTNFFRAVPAGTWRRRHGRCTAAARPSSRQICATPQATT